MVRALTDDRVVLGHFWLGMVRVLIERTAAGHLPRGSAPDLDHHHARGHGESRPYRRRLSPPRRADVTRAACEPRSSPRPRATRSDPAARLPGVPPWSSAWHGPRRVVCPRGRRRPMTSPATAEPTWRAHMAHAIPTAHPSIVPSRAAPTAYGNIRTACSRRPQWLLTAERVMSDGHPQGRPISPNGLTMFGAHHEASGSQVIGGRPDLELLEERRELLWEVS